MSTKAALLAHIDRLRGHKPPQPDPFHAQIDAVDLVVGDRVTFGGQEVEITGVDIENDYVHVTGDGPGPRVTRTGTFAVYLGFEQVEVALPRPQKEEQ